MRLLQKKHPRHAFPFLLEILLGGLKHVLAQRVWKLIHGQVIIAFGVGVEATYYII